MNRQTIQTGETRRSHRLVPVPMRLSFSGATLSIAAAGLVLHGYLAVVARNVPTAEYSHFGAFWSIALMVGFGAFLPVEQELARSLSGSGGRVEMLRNSAVAAGGVALASLAVLTAALPLVWPAIGERIGTLIALMALTVVSAVQFIVRGLLIGLRLLASHGLVQLVDAALRLALAGLAVLLISPDSVTFAWTVVCAIALAHLPLIPGLLRRAVRSRPREVQPPSGGYQAFASAIVPLLVASVSGQLLLNGMPVLVAALAADDERARAGQFVAAFLLTRLPLLIVVALQTALIALFVKLAREMERAALARLLGRLVFGVAALGAIGSLLALTAGAPLLELVFGDRYRLPGADLALLTAGVSAHIGLLVVTQALVALGLHRQVGTSWLAGLTAASITFVLIPDLLSGAEFGFLAGSAVGWALGITQILIHCTRRETAVVR